ncbi:MAG: hypothetical protein J6A22_00655 [Bacteroidales bacterium]|nr:hypothetical protein [Bacteroidales bacterium]
MKLRTMVTFAAIIMLTACGTTARYASNDSQRFHDGIYGDGPTFVSKAERQAVNEQTSRLIEETKASEVYLFGDKKDTIMIPQNMSATIRFDQKLGTTVSLYDNPYDWRNTYQTWGWYTPFTFTAGWSFGWGYRNWHMSIHNPYYWHYGRYYDPWYYDPWYGYMGWYDPWYHDPWFHNPWYHHYCGWYGGFGHIHHSWPHHPGHMHPGHIDPGHKPGHGSGGHGGRDVRYVPRHSTGSGQIYTTSRSPKQGNSTSTGIRPSTDNRLTSGRTSVKSSTGKSLRPISGRQVSSSSTGTSSSATRPDNGRTGKSQSTATSGNYRRPGTNAGRPAAAGNSSSSSSNGYHRNSGGFSSSSSQSRNSSSPSYNSSSSSSYNRSGSSSYNRSGSSSYNRSSSSSYNRSGSSSYGRSYGGGSTSSSGYSRSGGGRR